MRGIQRYDPFKMVELVEVSVRTMHSSCVMVLFQMDNGQLLLGFCRFEMKTPFLHSTYVSLFETVSISAAVLISVLQLYYSGLRKMSFLTFYKLRLTVHLIKKII
jgi:hypothetical protein